MSNEPTEIPVHEQAKRLGKTASMAILIKLYKNKRTEYPNGKSLLTEFIRQIKDILAEFCIEITKSELIKAVQNPDIYIMEKTGKNWTNTSEKVMENIVKASKHFKKLIQNLFHDLAKEEIILSVNYNIDTYGDESAAKSLHALSNRLVIQDYIISEINQMDFNQEKTKESSS